jgi:hypothetical protein
VVNAGEIKTAVGASMWQSVQGFINEKTGGLSYSASQLDQIFKAIMQVAKTVDKSISSKLTSLKKEAGPLSQIAIDNGMISPDKAQKLVANIGKVLTNRLNKYKVLSGGSAPQGIFKDTKIGDITGGSDSTDGKLTRVQEERIAFLMAVNKLTRAEATDLVIHGDK